jgi:hypothetical protein
MGKTRHWRGLSATKEGNSPKRGLPGWRRSADRTRLHLLTPLAPLNLLQYYLFEFQRRNTRQKENC